MNSAATSTAGAASGASCGRGEMAERDRVLERERRQMEQILELDMEELQVEEVDDDGSSSSSDVDTFLRSDRAPCPLFLARVEFQGIGWF
jgi:hypothetical protein